MRLNSKDLSIPTGDRHDGQTRHHISSLSIRPYCPVCYPGVTSLGPCAAYQSEAVNKRIVDFFAQPIKASGSSSIACPGLPSHDTRPLTLARFLSWHTWSEPKNLEVTSVVINFLSPRDPMVTFLLKRSQGVLRSRRSTRSALLPEQSRMIRLCASLNHLFPCKSEMHLASNVNMSGGQDFAGLPI